MFVCLIYTFDLFRGGSLLERLFVINHDSLHPRPAAWVGRNTIRQVRLSTQWNHVLLFSNMKKNLIHSMFQYRKHRIHPAIRSTYSDCDISIHRITKREKCYIHRTAKFCNWGNSHAVRKHDSVFLVWPHFDVQISEHIVIERNWKQQMVWQSVILCSSIVSYLVLVPPAELLRVTAPKTISQNNLLFVLSG